MVRTDRRLFSPPTDEKVERALRELKEVLADRADDPHAQEALQTLREAFCMAQSRASMDPLTGLMNRSSFERALELTLHRATHAGGRTALMFMDLDGFKTVNDRRGHAIGDLLLKDVASRIVGCMREGDLLARYGGDEFVVLLESLASLQVVHAIARRIIEALSAPFALEGLRVHISISIGIALFPEHAQNALSLLGCADAAMYAAKREGGGRYVLWSPESSADHSGSYAKLENNQRSTSATDMPLRRA